MDLHLHSNTVLYACRMSPGRLGVFRQSCFQSLQSRQFNSASRNYPGHHCAGDCCVLLLKGKKLQCKTMQSMHPN